jgi:hypothetical protein
MTMTNRAEIAALKITPLKVNKINYALYDPYYKDPDIEIFEFLIKKHLGQIKLHRDVLKTFFEGDIKAINQIIQDTINNLNLMEFTKLKYIAKEATIEMQHCIKDLYLSALVKESLNFASKEGDNTCKKFIYTFLDCLQPYTNQDHDSSCHIFTKDYLRSEPDLKSQNSYIYHFFNLVSFSISFTFSDSEASNSEASNSEVSNAEVSNAETLKNCFSALAFFIFENKYIPIFEKRLIISDIISLYDEKLDHKKLIKTSNTLLEKYNDPSDVSILSKFEAVLDTLEITEPASTQLSKMIVDAIEPSTSIKYDFEVIALSIFQSAHTCIKCLYLYLYPNLHLHPHTNNLYTLYTYTKNLYSSIHDWIFTDTETDQSLYTYTKNLYSSIHDWIFADTETDQSPYTYAFIYGPLN